MAELWYSMSDKQFCDVVIESQSMIGPQGLHHTAVCKTCSKQHKVSIDDFEMDSLYRLVSTEDGLDSEPANALGSADEEAVKEVLRYVAELRAWNCCHDGQEPLDGFPDEPNASRVHFGDL